RYDTEKWHREVGRFLLSATPGSYVRVASNTYDSGSRRAVRPVSVVRVTEAESKGIFSRRVSNITVKFPDGTVSKVFTTLFGQTIVSAEFLTRCCLKEAELELGIYEKTDALLLEEDLRRFGTSRQI
ncbi:MAG: hypothetical protein J5822_05310, partial [Eubacteriaceae bacterium]|nr:hypothetical protein [Eubacteriaceae bacterium]